MADLITLAFKAIELAKKLKAMVDQKAAADEGAAALHLAVDGWVVMCILSNFELVVKRNSC